MRLELGRKLGELGGHSFDRREDVPLLGIISLHSTNVLTKPRQYVSNPKPRDHHRSVSLIFESYLIMTVDTHNFLHHLLLVWRGTSYHHCLQYGPHL